MVIWGCKDILFGGDLADWVETRELFPGTGLAEVQRPQRVPAGLAGISVSEAVSLVLLEEEQEQIDDTLKRLFPASANEKRGFRRPQEVVKADHSARVVRFHISAYKPLPGEEETGFDYCLGVARVDHGGKISHVIEEHIPFLRDRRFYYLLPNSTLKIYREIPPIQIGQLALLEDESREGMAETDFTVLMRSLKPATWKTRASRYYPKMREGIFKFKHPLFAEQTS